MLTNLFAEYFAIFCLLKSASQLGLSRLTAQIHISNMLFKYYFTVWKLWNFTLIRKKFRENSLQGNLVLLNVLISRIFCKKNRWEKISAVSKLCILLILFSSEDLFSWPRRKCIWEHNNCNAITILVWKGRKVGRPYILITSTLF